MNPLTKVKLINELNEREAQLGVKESVSWHSEYKDSAWIFIGGFPYELTEGDIICVFSQYGEIANINLVRDKTTGKSKGFCFICFEDQRSTILAVDNFNGIKIKGRTIRVDHVQNYRPPKDHEDIDDVTKQLREQGCAPQRPDSSSSESEEEEEEEEEVYAVTVKKQKKDKKEKKKKKKEKKEKKKASKEEKRESRAQSPLQAAAGVKREREDAGYEKYTHQGVTEDRLPREERRAREDRNPRDRVHGDRHGDRERDGWTREEERRHGGREEIGSRNREGNGRNEDREKARREDRQQKTEGRHREDRDRERERDRSANYSDCSRDREHRRN